MKINKDYFRLSSKITEIRYFLSQGHVLAHLIDRLKWHWCPKLHMTPNFPSHVDIEVSSKCQLQCPMCGQRRMDSELKGNMDFELYKGIIDECVARHVYSIKLSWRGEPLLNPNLFKMIRYAKDKGIKDVAFLTNVEGFDDDEVQQLMESGVDWISCSVDGLYETYDRIRYPAKFEDIVEKIKKIVQIRRKVNRQKPLVRIQTIFSAIKSNPGEYKSFWEPIVDKINFIADQIRQTDDKDFPADPEFVCQSPWQRMCIAYDGKVIQCHSDYLEKNILGDVKKQSLYQIWHGEPFKEVRKLHKSKQSFKLKPCSECSDRGEMEEVTIDVGGKKQNILRYVGQELDLENMDARRGSKSKTLNMVKPPLKRSYVNNPERNPFRKIWDSDRFRNPTKYPLANFSLLVDVESTNCCNLHCTFCATQIMKRDKGFMDLNLYKQVVDEIAQNSSAIKFSRWGEPFLHPKIYEMLAYAKEKGLIVHVTTNGTLVDPYKLENIDSINFSFQGTTKEEYEIIRGNDFYDLIVDKIDTLLHLENRPAVGITTTVLDETEEQVADFINKWITKVEQVSWGYTYYEHLNSESAQQFRKRQGWGGRQLPCNNVLVDLGVDWDGYVTACCADYDRLMALGSLKDSTIKELWTCEKMQTYRKLILSGQKDKIQLCRTCGNRW